ncbi:glycosyltransferase [Acidithiobacillus ferridurans]|nr:glycosyltransferase [Acidithiobacillus ferridurans]
MLEDEAFYFCKYDDFVSHPDQSVQQLSDWLDICPENIEDVCHVIQPALRHHSTNNDSDLSPALAELSLLLLNRKLHANNYLQLREQFVTYGYAALIAEKSKWLNILRQSLKDKDAIVTSLTEALSLNNQNIEELKSIITEIRCSPSWRITAPLRGAVGVTRNATRVLRHAHGSILGLFKISSWRGMLVQRGHTFYRQHMKRSRLGRWIGHQALKRGLVQPAELQISTLTLRSQAIDKMSVAQVAQPVEGNGFAVFHAGPSEADSAVPGFHLSPPLNLEITDALAVRSCINVLLPSLRTKHMSGGPNTALLFAAMLAERGERIRLIACDAPTEAEEAALYQHMDNLLRRPVLRDQIELVDAFDRTKPTSIGINDLFFATAWWTAQMARYATKKTLRSTFIYLIQDFEPILHDGSTFQARALETYGLAHIPLINTRLLLDHLVKEGVGQYAVPDFAQNALCFEPALDRNYYFPDPDKIGQCGKKVLLFYARPTVARRNLFEIGVVALRQAVASGAIDSESWEVWAMGENLPPVALGHGVYLNPLPWMNYQDYAKRVRTADLMLSLMLSPHPSYPPIEMAASGNLVVTNSYSVKTAQRMRVYSPNIVVAEPTTESISIALQNAAGRINVGLSSYDPSGTSSLPSNWNDSLDETMDGLMQRIQTLRATPSLSRGSQIHGFPSTPITAYESYRLTRLSRRRCTGEYQQEAGLLSFVTPVYNTDPVFLEALGRSVFLQDGGTQFEWLILDNGSTREDTRHELQKLSRHPSVRLKRVEDNLGIIGGMHFCLEQAEGRYILPLDSDDLIEPDCVHVLTSFIKENNHPPLLYTDEDKFSTERFGSQYFKPDWDPVLFLHSCYIAHLCAIDREKALELGLYSDKGAEGCHDWDSFIRFMTAGHRPCHIPEVLYSWRIHSGSTSENIASKPYITASHKNTLQRFLNHSGVPNIELVNSPLFDYNVDWWFRRQRVAPRAMRTIIIGINDGAKGAASEGAGMSPPLVLNPGSKISELAALIKHDDSELIHICWQDVVPDDDEWQWDAMALLELFPDSVMVGGILHNGRKIVDGPRVFGFGEGFDCPDSGRLLADPGYGAKMWKPHTASAVSTAHCVIRARFLRQCMAELLEEVVPIEMLGPWLGAQALEAGSRVVCSPFMRARLSTSYENALSRYAKEHFLSRFWPLIPDQRVYSSRLGLDPTKAYAEVEPEENQRHLLRLQAQLLSYPKWLEMHLRRRADSYPIPENPALITLITTVYEGTNMGFLDELAESVMGQIVKAAQWVIVAHGPITTENIEHIVSNSAERWRATVITEPQSLGIMGAMRRGLENAQGEYVVPVDADDVLTPDAIHILTNAITRLVRPDLIFSDEDVLVGGQPASPYLRSVFDPVLNLDSSYIWHLCAINRERAMALELYTDLGATWCHDWDSVMRVANADGRIDHIPEVLYHWRQHTGSTTNNAQGDPRSRDSVRHILERHIARTAAPQRFYVAEWPDNRGARELYIARRPDDLPQFVWIGDVAAEGNLKCDENAILVVASNGVMIESQQVFVEVARLLELHPHVGVVGGLVEDKDGMVVDGCYMVNGTGMLESPWLGQPASHGGPYALALKTQSVATTGNSLAFFRISALKRAVAWPLAVYEVSSDTVMQLCGRLAENGWNVAFSPLVRARAGSAFHSEQSRRRPPSGVSCVSHALVRYGMGRNFRI